MERTFSFGIALTLALAASLLAAAGCSNLEGKKYRYGDSNADGTLDGVPFTINKPVPTVTHTVAADTGKESYQVTFAYVADSERRYLLQISPSMLASVDFAMTFDTGGSLTEVTAKSTDQTGALISTIGKLAVLAAGDTSSDYDKAVVQRVRALGDEFSLTLSPREAAKVAWTSIRAAMDELGTVQAIRAEYVYSTPDELAFLRAFSVHLKRFVPRPDAPNDAGPLAPSPGARTFWELHATYTGAGEKDFAAEVGLDFLKGDVRRLNERKTEQLTTLQSNRAGWAATQTADRKAQVDGTLRRIRLLKAAVAGLPGEVKLVEDMADLSLTEWQKRSVTPLNKEIESTQQLIRVAEASRVERVAAERRAHLHALMMRKTSILGVSREYQRRQALTDALATSTTAKDLKALRDERDALDVIIAAAEPGKPKAKVPKVDEPSVATYLTVGPGETVDANGIINRLNGDRPRYVIVARSLEHPAAAGGMAADKTIPKAEGPKAVQPGSAGDLPIPQVPPVPPVKSVKEN
jgi:hypothetical protein